MRIVGISVETNSGAVRQGRELEEHEIVRQLGAQVVAGVSAEARDSNSFAVRTRTVQIVAVNVGIGSDQLLGGAMGCGKDNVGGCNKCRGE